MASDAAAEEEAKEEQIETEQPERKPDRNRNLEGDGHAEGWQGVIEVDARGAVVPGCQIQ